MLGVNANLGGYELAIFIVAIGFFGLLVSLAAWFAKGDEDEESSVKDQSMNKRAFTLVELMVVIAIIGILVAITIAVGSALGAASSKTQTQNYMEVLDAALTEWKNRSGRDVTWGTDGFPSGPNWQATYDMQIDTPHVFLLSDFLGTVSASTDTGGMFAQIDQEHLVLYSATTVPEWIRNPSAFEPDPNVANWGAELVNWVGFPTVLDSWDHPIRAIHPGRKFEPRDPWFDAPPIMQDADGSVRTAVEDIYGVCESGRILLVSAGPDGEFGHLHLDIQQANLTAPQLEDIDRAADNIYSYEPMDERP